MPIPVTCPCGREYRVSDAHAGKKIRCRDCNRAVEVLMVAQEASEEIESDFQEMAVTAQPKFRLNPPPDEAPLPPPPRPKRRRRRRRYDDDGGGVSFAISTGVISGACMMLGAVVWFVLGLFLGWIFFYPPILFVVGLVVMVRAIMGHED